VRISFRALCLDCAIKRGSMPAEQLTAREGPVYEQWKRSMKEAADRL